MATAHGKHMEIAVIGVARSKAIEPWRVHHDQDLVASALDLFQLRGQAHAGPFRYSYLQLLTPVTGRGLRVLKARVKEGPFEIGVDTGPQRLKVAAKERLDRD